MSGSSSLTDITLPLMNFTLCEHAQRGQVIKFVRAVGGVHIYFVLSCILFGMNAVTPVLFVTHAV